MKGREQIEKRLAEIEKEMGASDFWQDKDRAQKVVKEYNELKEGALGVGKHDKGNAILTIFAGAGGDDAEDFARMLFQMYRVFIENSGWELFILHKNENDHNGFRNITFDVRGKGAYGILKNEAGVHRLVRISPFSAKKQRHTSFAMVDVIPEIPKAEAVEIPEGDIRVEFARSSGPGGQNVNKRETAVRIVHLPTNIAVHVESERSQERNRDRALEILRGKLYRRKEEEAASEEAKYHVSKTTEAEWGSQMRSYVLHPYKLVKDHRTDVEVRDTEAVLERGELGPFIEAEKDL
ncbi:MAG: PCRF domain-containing protein [Parcubacteria group bacterium]|nr:PCRF domain-containing protein [Parcubacteria group bacterium]